MFQNHTLTATLVLATFAFAGSHLNRKQMRQRNAEAEKIGRARIASTYTLSEIEEGKKINTRQYSMHSRSGRPKRNQDRVTCPRGNQGRRVAISRCREQI